LESPSALRWRDFSVVFENNSMCLFVSPKTTDFGDTEGHKSRFLLCLHLQRFSKEIFLVRNYIEKRF